MEEFPNLGRAKKFVAGEIGQGLDKLTQKSIELMGRHVSYEEYPWLKGPVGKDRGITESSFPKLADEQNTGELKNEGRGLLDNFKEALASSHFDPDLVAPEIRSFYEHTSGYQLDLKVGWPRFYKSLARLSQFLFANRLQQINIPLEGIRGGKVQSDIYSFTRLCGDLAKATGWLRKNPDTGDIILAGVYTTERLPNKPDVKYVKVAFPVPGGNVSVFLEPRNLPDGGIELESKGEKFGDAGMYLVRNKGDNTANVIYLKSLTQSLDVTKDEAGKTGATHKFAFGGNTILNLDYSISPKASGGRVPQLEL